MRIWIKWMCPMLMLGTVCTGAIDHDAILNLGFSPHIFADVKKTDAAASIRVWGETLLEGRDLSIGKNPAFYDNTEEMKQALCAGEVDMVTMLTYEFLEIQNEVGLDSLHFAVTGGTVYEEYLLLVHRDSSLENVEALEGKKLALADGARMGMGKRWLDTSLMERGFSGIDGYFGSVDLQTKGPRAAMSVFFGNADACVINRTGFETMAELNPQIKKRLRVLQTSPRFIPSLVCVRGTYDPDLKKQLVHSFVNLHNEVRGKQILTVFKSEQLFAGTVEDLATTREWIEKQARLKKKIEGAPVVKLAEVSE